MTRISLIMALGVILGFAMPGASTAKAASAMSSPALALGEQITGVQQSNVAKADVGFRLYIGPRYHRYRYRHYRRYRRPHYRRYRRYRRSHRGRSCRYWSRRCARNWGYGNSNYYGCMRYHGCR